MEEPIVAVESRRVRGFVAGGVRTFLGIPCAASPLDDRRFALPRPSGPWGGVREGIRSAPSGARMLRLRTSSPVIHPPATGGTGPR